MTAMRSLLLAGVVVCVASSSAQAQRLYDDISNRDLLFLLRDMGFDNVEYYDNADDDSWTRIEFEDRRRRMYIYNYERGSLMLAAYYECLDGETRSTLSQVNEWNRTYRWTRAYVSTEGNWVIESDLDMSEGCSDDHIETFIDTWVDLLDEFEDHVDF